MMSRSQYVFLCYISGGCKATPLGTMSLLSWNYRELGNLRIVKALQRVVNKEDLVVVFLIETIKFGLDG